MKLWNLRRCSILKDDINRLNHMLDAINDITEFTKDKKRNDLKDDKMLSYSLVHLLELIGEAANGISNEFQMNNSNIPWKAIIGMRNRLIHGYFDIDLNIVWKTVNKDIPKLKREIEKIIMSEKE